MKRLSQVSRHLYLIIINVADVEKMSRSYSKLSRSALNRIDKTKFTSMDDNLEIVESPNKNRAPSIFDLSIEEEDSFTDCKTDPDDDAITLTHDTKKTAGANLRKTSTQCVEVPGSFIITAGSSKCFQYY